MGKIEEISQIARPDLGDSVPLIIFRAFRHFSADYVRLMLGRSSTVVFQNSGRDLGREAGVLLMKPSLDEYLGEVVRFVRDLKIGHLKAHEISEDVLKLGLEECITCSGMEPQGGMICHFEAGFVAGVVESFVQRRVRASETLCNYNGDGICEVTVDLTLAKDDSYRRDGRERHSDAHVLA